jgi:hypothetical protein
MLYFGLGKNDKIEILSSMNSNEECIGNLILSFCVILSYLLSPKIHLILF